MGGRARTAKAAHCGRNGLVRARSGDVLAGPLPAPSPWLHFEQEPQAGPGPLLRAGGVATLLRVSCCP